MYDTAGIRGIVACVVHKGVNASVFAYGCTGSGKSHTMQGAPSEEGIVPRALRQVLAAAAEEEEDGGGGGGSCRVLISIFEIYQEKLRDLLVFDDAAGAGADAGGGVWGKRKQSFGSSSGSGRSGFLFGGSNGAQHHHHHQRVSFAPNVDRGGGIGARNSADLPVREDAKGNIIVPGLNETEVKVRVCVFVGRARRPDLIHPATHKFPTFSFPSIHHDHRPTRSSPLCTSAPTRSGRRRGRGSMPPPRARTPCCSSKWSSRGARWESST